MKTEIKIIFLNHPLHQLPSVGKRVGWYHKNGRAVGYELQFPDGHRCKLTFEEIRELMSAEEDSPATEREGTI